MSQLLQRFIDSFHRAIGVEMDAMRQRLGSFEVPLADGQALPQEGEKCRAAFRVLQANDKLVVHGECTFAAGDTETLVTLLAVDAERVELGSDRPLDLEAPQPRLVIYPWFLYEKLRAVLRDLPGDPSLFPEVGLTLFGQSAPRSFDVEPEAEPAVELNDSQRRAVELCRRLTPAFVWGPPGTGKTTTLGHIVTSLLRIDQRILITSTTNAAVDGALATFLELPAMRAALEAGHVVRVGTGGQPGPAQLDRVVKTLNGRTLTEIDRLVARRDRVREQRAGCETLTEALGAETAQQLGLFGGGDGPAVQPWQLRAVFGEHLVEALTALPADVLKKRVAQRHARLDRIEPLLTARIAARHRGLRDEEGRVIRQARVVLATMSNVYINRRLEAERFDTVIVEEAGMAILPTLFYCACLARERTVMVGDPQQLPPIVQSNADYVHRAMGRGIFAVTVPDPHASDLVVMLDTQYRMHPSIGDLVGRLFYEGRLSHGTGVAEETAELAQRAPFPGAAVVVVDTAGRASCATPEGSYSRFNEVSAERCAALAREALADGIHSIAIITPYAQQSRVIRRLLTPDEQRHVECRTVHRFQGSERDLVIVDMVDADPLPPGVLLAGQSPGAQTRNLINVSLSRARGKLILLADVAYFRRHEATRWLSSVLDAASEAGRVEPL